jgi:hypothetical protein
MLHFKNVLSFNYHIPQGFPESVSGSAGVVSVVAKSLMLWCLDYAFHTQEAGAHYHASRRTLSRASRRRLSARQSTCLLDHHRKSLLISHVWADANALKFMVVDMGSWQLPVSSAFSKWTRLSALCTIRRRKLRNTRYKYVLIVFSLRNMTPLWLSRVLSVQLHHVPFGKNIFWINTRHKNE